MSTDWKVCFFNTRLERDVLALPAGLLARFPRYSERLETSGPDLGMPRTKALGKGLFELRLNAEEGIARVLYCTTPNRRVVMLHQFVKKSQRTPPGALETARRRMKEIANACLP